MVLYFAVTHFEFHLFVLARATLLSEAGTYKLFTDNEEDKIEPCEGEFLLTFCVSQATSVVIEALTNCSP